MVTKGEVRQMEKEFGDYLTSGQKDLQAVIKTLKKSVGLLRECRRGASLPRSTQMKVRKFMDAWKVSKTLGAHVK